jgi:hypothetical protein
LVDFVWLGAIVTAGGTFMLVRDALKLRPPPSGITAHAAILAVAFCAFWAALAVAVIWGCSTVVFRDAPWPIID